jgi:hypothetical protein
MPGMSAAVNSSSTEERGLSAPPVSYRWNAVPAPKRMKRTGRNPNCQLSYVMLSLFLSFVL